MPPAENRQHRLLTTAAGLVVAVLAGGAFVVTYDLLREFALAGRASRRWAPAYPVMTDALVVMTVLSLIVARNAPWWSRWLRGALLLLLVAGTAAIAVQHALWGFGSVPDDPVRAGVAVAPHIMLIIAVWLWLRMIRQLRRPAEEAPPEVPAPRPAEPPPLPLVSLDKNEDEDEGEGEDTESTDPNGIDTSEELPIWEWDPPSSSVRSSPTPPGREDP
ncbi:hypothetical protein GCM10010191_42980 [Actinomadura vinacea]|uniref:DUF2637 domain-containing protein n=1 Tax=Actinomadura vinacea TaxID=115336 RepID=A0ABN3JDQ6_9ACTN